MTAEQAIHTFWSSFGLAAYDENSVPDTATLPYITYALSYSVFGDEALMEGSLWYRSISWQAITDKCNEISRFIGDGGIMLETDNGNVWITRGSPFANRMGDTDKNIKRIIINVIAEYFQQN